MIHLKKIVALNLIPVCLFGQAMYKGLPVVRARLTSADFRIGNERVNGNWTISPWIESDSLVLTCFKGAERFAFYTDLDSIAFDIGPDEARGFYVSLSDTAYAFTLIKGVKPGFESLKFDHLSKDNALEFWYESNIDNVYLDKLRSEYPIDELISGVYSDSEKTLKILHWVHSQWSHNGDNQPSKADAISILEEAKEGRNFRCVEYGIVATACLNAIGLKARTLALKTKDVETTEYGAGHVLTEVYLNDLEKWALLDGQWDVMPLLEGIPLNAVEFQRAISEHYNEVEIRSLSGTSKRHYIDWIYPYLFYFDVCFDNRERIAIEWNTIKGMRSLMLVPENAPKPTIFQISHKIDNCLYTHSLRDFYARPEE